MRRRVGGEITASWWRDIPAGVVDLEVVPHLDDTVRGVFATGPAFHVFDAERTGCLEQGARHVHDRKADQ